MGKMKNKVICPDCGFVYDIIEFLERLKDFGNEATEIGCESCFEKILVTWKNISYQSYEINLQTNASRPKDFIIRTYNKHNSNKLAGEFRGHNWSRVSEFAKEPTESEFKEAVKELKEELIEAAERYYSFNLKSIQKIKESLK